jgi:preprotein translocase subunit SecF
MELKTIPFMRWRYHAVVFSAVVMLWSIFELAVNGLNFALDFTGGTQIEVSYQQSADLEQVRQSLTAGGYPNHEVVQFGSDRNVLIRLQSEEEGDARESGVTAAAVLEILRNSSGEQVQLERSEFVGSQVGDELKEQGGLGMLVALGMIMIYIALRFQFKFSVGAVASLAHDVIITLGFFAVTQIDFDLTVLAAVLAVIGYSLNDTIVVADRVRENLRILRGKEPEEVIDIAVTQTLIRTTITSLTTLLVLCSLYWFGGQVVRGFSVALIVGVVIGTYSSIYVASSILLFMHITKEDLMPPARDKEELDALP